jgi:hypothetical protein
MATFKAKLQGMSALNNLADGASRCEGRDHAGSCARSCRARPTRHRRPR